LLSVERERDGGRREGGRGGGDRRRVKGGRAEEEPGVCGEVDWRVDGEGGSE